MSSVATIGFVLFSLPFLGVGLAGLAFSASAFYDAGTKLFTTVHTAVTEPVDPGEVPESGHVVVTGTVDAGPDGELTTPFSGSSAVACRYGIQQRSDGVGWWQVADTEYAEPFVLKGSLDRILVDPGDESLDVAFETDATVDGDSKLPDRTRESIRESAAIDLDALPQVRAAAVDEPRRYEEGTVQPGETLSVYGAVTDGGVHGSRIDAAESRAFQIVRGSPEEITDPGTEDARSVGGLVLIGLIALFFGVMFGGAGTLVLLTGLDQVIV